MEKWLVWQDSGSGIIKDTEEEALEYANDWVNDCPVYTVLVCRIEWRFNRGIVEHVRHTDRS